MSSNFQSMGKRYAQSIPATVPVRIPGQQSVLRGGTPAGLVPLAQS
ncbi:hypothetical protein NHF46_17740 [Arthrobacter alpinus]|nr:hypothetical protein [Arthrobacter alpinus]